MALSGLLVSFKQTNLFALAESTTFTRALILPFLVSYFMPYSYYLHAQMQNTLIDTTWNVCDPLNNYEQSPVCVMSNTGAAVLEGIGLSYPLINSEDTYWKDFGILLAIAMAFKLMYVLGVFVKSGKVATIYPTEARSVPPPATAVTTSHSAKRTHGLPRVLGEEIREDDVFVRSAKVATIYPSRFNETTTQSTKHSHALSKVIGEEVAEEDVMDLSPLERVGI